MIFPDYWDEHKEKRKISVKSQATITRFGWSDNSQVDAKRHAKQRVDQAFDKLANGEKVERQEKRVSYNGSEGVPIREEIIQFHGDAVVSRNIYGALCLNTPDVVFADIDFGANWQTEKSTTWVWALFVLGLLHYSFMPSFLQNISMFIIGFDLHYYTDAYLSGINPGLLVSGLASIIWIIICVINASSFVDDQQWAQNAMDFNMPYIEEFSQAHPEWNLRIYRTLAGLRIMVMHDVFQSSDPSVEEFFESVNTDPTYVWMCKRQECFRARVSPKPWRTGLNGKDAKLMQGVWPIQKGLAAERKKWVSLYEKTSEDFASCRFEKSLGSDTIHEKCEKLRVVHDEYCKALEPELPLA